MLTFVCLLKNVKNHKKMNDDRQWFFPLRENINKTGICSAIVAKILNLKGHWLVPIGLKSNLAMGYDDVFFFFFVAQILIAAFS